MIFFMFDFSLNAFMFKETYHFFHSELRGRHTPHVSKMHYVRVKNVWSTYTLKILVYIFLLFMYSVLICNFMYSSLNHFKLVCILYFHNEKNMYVFTYDTELFFRKFYKILVPVLFYLGDLPSVSAIAGNMNKSVQDILCDCLPSTYSLILVDFALNRNKANAVNCQQLLLSNVPKEVSYNIYIFFNFIFKIYFDLHLHIRLYFQIFLLF